MMLTIMMLMMHDKLKTKLQRASFFYQIFLHLTNNCMSCRRSGWYRSSYNDQPTF